MTKSRLIAVVGRVRISRATITRVPINNNYYSLGFLDVTMSRDPNDYMITERWRDVEQPLSGDTRILSIWIAWGNVKNEVIPLIIVIVAICNNTICLFLSIAGSIPSENQ